MKIINQNNIKKIIYQLIPVLVFFIDPFNLNLAQRLVFSALLLTIIWWTTEFVKRDIACVFLLIIFLIFGSSTPYQIFNFAFSSRFY
ncbi:MAG: hypothetical protein QME73_08350, partial [Bacillota bacterium]|nr:hypothetical protein [Bacillota bacterium]